MKELSFSLRAETDFLTNLKCQIDESKINGTGPEYPQLNLTSRLYSKASGIPGTLYINRISGFLQVTSTKTKFVFGKFDIPVNMKISSGEIWENLDIDIPINFWILEKLEQQREGDLIFLISLQIHFIFQKSDKYIYVNSSDKNGVKLSIPQSTWIKTLENIGFVNVKILEIPYPMKIKHEDFDILIGSIQKAKDKFLKGYYHDCVAHCRDIYDSIHKLDKVVIPQGERKNTTNKLKFFCEQHLEPIIGKKKNKLLKTQITEFWEFTSKFHHTGYDKISNILRVNRQDAEYVLISTSNILSFLMKILSENY